jgi:trimethylamine---corrinoid protein Co-methyltransferase
MTPHADTSRPGPAAPQYSPAGAASLAADLWPPEAIAAIAAASLELLARVGVRVDSPEAAALLGAAGGTPGPQGRVLLPAATVDAALQSCRGEFILLARDPAHDLYTSPAPVRVHVHNMGEAPMMGDPRTGRLRPATFRDQVLATRVMHHGRYPDSINSLVTPGDVPPELHPLYSYFAIASETDKPIGGPGQDHSWQTPVLFAMAEAVLSARPGEVPAGAVALGMGYSPVSPLHLSTGVCDGIIAAARAGMAVQPLTNPVAGTTAPASLAGALAQQDAEILAGVVLAQAARPGTPCDYGARLSVADPRDGRLLCGSGQWALASVGATLLARSHGLACDCYGPDTSAPLVDVQAGYQSALPALAGALARPCTMSGIGAWGDTATCLELLVIGDAVYRQALDSLDPPAWDADALDVDAIIEGVRGGSGFLGTHHTRRWLRGNRASEDLSWRGLAEEWEAAGSPGTLDLATARVEQSLAREPVGLPDDVETELCRLIDEAAATAGLSDHPDPRRLLEEARA